MELNQGIRGTVYSAENGIVDTITDDGILATAQDVTAIIEANKRKQNAVRQRKPGWLPKPLPKSLN